MLISHTRRKSCTQGLRNGSRKFAIFTSSIFSLILASIQSWILEFLHRYNLCNTAVRVFFLKLWVQNKCWGLCCNVCFEVHDFPFCLKVLTAPIYNILWSVYYRMYSTQFFSRAWNWFAWDANIQRSFYFYILLVHLNFIFSGIKLFSFLFRLFCHCFNFFSVFLTSHPAVRTLHPASRVFGMPEYFVVWPADQELSLNLDNNFST